MVFCSWLLQRLEITTKCGPFGRPALDGVAPAAPAAPAWVRRTSSLLDQCLTAVKIATRSTATIIAGPVGFRLLATIHRRVETHVALQRETAMVRRSRTAAPSCKSTGERLRYGLGFAPCHGSIQDCGFKILGAWNQVLTIRTGFTSLARAANLAQLIVLGKGEGLAAGKADLLEELCWEQYKVCTLFRL